MSLVSNCCGIVRAVCLGAEIINDLDQMKRDSSGLRTASVVTQSGILALTVTQLVNTIFGQKGLDLQRNLKLTEFLVRLVDLPITTAKIATDPEGNPARIIEKVVLNNVLSFVRVALELDIIKEKKYLKMPADEREKLQRPIYESDYDSEGPSHKLVGYKPIDVEECKKIIASDEKALPFVSVAEAVTKFGAIERTLLATGIITPRTPPTTTPSPDEKDGEFRPDVESLFDFKRWKRIPQEFDKDEVFKTFTCAISKGPIRFPVADPTTQNRTLYEREEILRHLKQRPQSPATNQPLLPSMLVACPNIQALIDDRLDYYEQITRREIELNLATPAIQALLNAAQQDQTSPQAPVQQNQAPQQVTAAPEANNAEPVPTAPH